MTELAQARLQSLTNVSRETMGRLEQFTDMLLKWNKAINLISRSTESQVWQRHILDSAQIWPLIPPDTKTWLDIGSGAGFPGLVIAIIAKEHKPDLEFTMVESDLRKSSFLMQVSNALNINATVQADRVENLSSQNADVISARALASISDLLYHSERHSAENGINIYLKGQNADTELEDAKKTWKFTVKKTESITSPDGVLLNIGKPTRA